MSTDKINWGNNSEIIDNVKKILKEKGYEGNTLNKISENIESNLDKLTSKVKYYNKNNLEIFINEFLLLQDENIGMAPVSINKSKSKKSKSKLKSKSNPKSKKNNERWKKLIPPGWKKLEKVVVEKNIKENLNTFYNKITNDNITKIIEEIEKIYTEYIYKFQNIFTFVCEKRNEEIEKATEALKKRKEIMDSMKWDKNKANIVAFKDLRKFKDDVKQNKINQANNMSNLDIKIENELKEKINKIIENINSDTNSDIGVAFLLDVIKSNIFYNFVNNNECLNEFKSFKTTKGLQGNPLSSNYGLAGYFGLLEYLNEAQHRKEKNLNNNIRKLENNIEGNIVNTNLEGNIVNTNLEGNIVNTNLEENHMYKGVYYPTTAKARNLKEAEKRREKERKQKNKEIRIGKTTKKLDIIDPNTGEIVE
jgi:hypothetical protein